MQKVMNERLLAVRRLRWDFQWMNEFPLLLRATLFGFTIIQCTSMRGGHAKPIRGRSREMMNATVLHCVHRVTLQSLQVWCNGYWDKDFGLFQMPHLEGSACDVHGRLRPGCFYFYMRLPAPRPRGTFSGLMCAWLKCHPLKTNMHRKRLVPILWLLAFFVRFFLERVRDVHVCRYENASYTQCTPSQFTDDQSFNR